MSLTGLTVKQFFFIEWICVLKWQYLSPHGLYVLFQGLGTNTGLCYGSYVTPLAHGMNLVQTDSLPSTQVLVPGSPPVAAQSSSSSSISTCSSSSSSSSQKLQRPDKLEVPVSAEEWERARNRQSSEQGSLLISPFFVPLQRCAGSFSGETVQEVKRIAASLTPATAQWSTPPTTPSLFAWITSRAAAPGTSASISIRRPTYRPKSNPVSSKSVRLLQQARLHLW